MAVVGGWRVKSWPYDIIQEKGLKERNVDVHEHGESRRGKGSNRLAIQQGRLTNGRAP